MKQAILVTAYKNYFHLESIIKFFDDDFQIYIHLDAKSKIGKTEFENIREYSNVKLFTQKYKVNWGGINHLKAILYLLHTASQDKSNQYFHLISGHDYPIKDIGYFKSFISSKGHKNYLEFFNVPFDGWGGNGGMDRLEYFNLFDVFNYKDDNQIKWINKALRIQKRLGYKRKFDTDFPQLYGGSTWWSLNREAIDYVLKYLSENPKYLKRFKHTLCSEEFFFQTILLNSSLNEKIINFNLRYIDWTPRNGNNPAILDEGDFEKIKATDALFARKIDYPISGKLIDQLNKSK